MSAACILADDAILRAIILTANWPASRPCFQSPARRRPAGRVLHARHQRPVVCPLAGAQRPPRTLHCAWPASGDVEPSAWAGAWRHLPRRQMDTAAAALADQFSHGELRQPPTRTSRPWSAPARISGLLLQAAKAATFATPKRRGLPDRHDQPPAAISARWPMPLDPGIASRAGRALTGPR